MLKLKQKAIEVELRPTVEIKEDKTPVYGEPFPFKLLLYPLKTPALINLQAQLNAVNENARNEEAYKTLSQILGKTLEGWEGLTPQIVEEITHGEIEDVPEGHSIHQPSLRVTKDNRAEAVDVVMLLAENNLAFYGALSASVLALGMQKKKEIDEQKKI